MITVDHSLPQPVDIVHHKVVIFTASQFERRSQAQKFDVGLQDHGSLVPGTLWSKNLDGGLHVNDGLLAEDVDPGHGDAAGGGSLWRTALVQNIGQDGKQIRAQLDCVGPQDVPDDDSLAGLILQSTRLRDRLK